MVLSYTDRLGLPIWGAGTDVPTRDEFNAAMEQIDATVAGFSVGTGAPISADAPLDGGSFYYDTATGLMWFFDGTDEASWRSVGRVVAGTMVVKGPTGGANLLELRDPSNSVVMSVSANGALSLPANEAPTLITPLPGAAPWSGGSASKPSFYRSAEGRIDVQGAVTPTATSFSMANLPRPRDLADHVWNKGTVVSTLQGAIGTLSVVGLTVGTRFFLDGISYYAER